MYTYIIDENLTPDLADLFRSAGLNVAHVNEIKANQKQRIIDDQLRRLAIQKGYIIVTKDDDFVKSYVSREVPERMIFIYGLDRKETLLIRMKEVLPQIETLMSKHNFIEINESEIRFPFEP
ncbi:DUF5615 family PIN-like protein [Ekhidna sp. To15]|uniref:DUF5615 family PIN-like protein n=1 Tax=Ekhidna sp. To15 TaxID=3395267 RepID=UPI003F51EEEC